MEATNHQECELSWQGVLSSWAHTSHLLDTLPGQGAAGGSLCRHPGKWIDGGESVLAFLKKCPEGREAGGEGGKASGRSCRAPGQTARDSNPTRSAHTPGLPGPEILSSSQKACAPRATCWKSHNTENAIARDGKCLRGGVNADEEEDLAWSPDKGWEKPAVDRHGGGRVESQGTQTPCVQRRLSAGPEPRARNSEVGRAGGLEVS